MRELRCGLTDEAMQLLKKCKKKKAKLKIKRLTDSDDGKSMVELVRRRYQEEHKQYLEEERKKEEEKSRKRPMDRSMNKVVIEKSSNTQADEAIIDELLKDDSSDNISIESGVLEENPKKRIKMESNKRSLEGGSDSNSFVKFENIGFRTNGSFVVKDEIVAPSSQRSSFSVPPSLPSLQKKAKSKEV